jgi:uncharacterized glyoxalase superfamily protein PhnB
MVSESTLSLNLEKDQYLCMSYSDFEQVKTYSSYLSFDVTDLDSTITKLLSMGAELDGPIKHEIHGKVYAC